MKNFSIISACDANFGIGKNNLLPWKIPSELKYFQEVTQNSTVIMGRNTWDSLPAKSKPLANRQNIIITRSQDLIFPIDVLSANSLDSALELSSNQTIFVIGGAQIYAQAIQHRNCQKVYLTRIKASFDCDTFFPEKYLAQNFKLISESEPQNENGHTFTFQIYS